MKKYIAKESKTFWVILIVLTTFNLLFLEQRFLYLPHLVIVLLVLALFLHYELSIDHDNRVLQLQIKLFGFVLVNRTAAPDNMNEAYFIKMRNKKFVLLKVKGAFRWKLTDFTPEDFDVELMRFFTDNQVNIKKLNGYK